MARLHQATPTASLSLPGVWSGNSKPPLHNLLSKPNPSAHESATTSFPLYAAATLVLPALPAQATHSYTICNLANEGHRGICGHVLETDDQLEFLRIHEERCRMYMCGTGTRILAERVEAFGGRAAAQNTLHPDGHTMYQDMRYMIWYTNECGRKSWGRVVDVTDMCRACRNLPGNRIPTAYYAEDQHGLRTSQARRERRG